MNPYMVLSSDLGTDEAMSLSAKLSAWHDATVTHERRLRTVSRADACHDESVRRSAPLVVRSSRRFRRPCA